MPFEHSSGVKFGVGRVPLTPVPLRFDPLRNEQRFKKFCEEKPK
jgi:hypothetical protein